MVKNFFKKHSEMIAICAGFIVIFAILIFGFGGLIKAEASKPITVEEYQVLTVYQYSAPITNGYGGVRGHETRYHVTYFDNNGNICEKEMYNAAGKSDNPYEAVYIGEDTKLVIKRKGSTDWFALYLTESDFEAMKYKLVE